MTSVSLRFVGFLLANRCWYLLFSLACSLNVLMCFLRVCVYDLSDSTHSTTSSSDLKTSSSSSSSKGDPGPTGKLFVPFNPHLTDNLTVQLSSNFKIGKLLLMSSSNSYNRLEILYIDLLAMYCFDVIRFVPQLGCKKSII